jgi:hypothetical protein
VPKQEIGMSQKPSDDKKLVSASEARNPDYPNLVAVEATSILVSHNGVMDDDLMDALIAEQDTEADE